MGCTTHFHFHNHVLSYSSMFWWKQYSLFLGLLTGSGLLCSFSFSYSCSFLFFWVFRRTILPISITFNREWGLNKAHDSNHGLCSGIHHVKLNNSLDPCSYGGEACWTDASWLTVTTHFRKTYIWHRFYQILTTQ